MNFKLQDFSSKLLPDSFIYRRSVPAMRHCTKCYGAAIQLTVCIYSYIASCWWKYSSHTAADLIGTYSYTVTSYVVQQQIVYVLTTCNVNSDEVQLYGSKMIASYIYLQLDAMLQSKGSHVDNSYCIMQLSLGHIFISEKSNLSFPY